MIKTAAEGVVAVVSARKIAAGPEEERGAAKEVHGAASEFMSCEIPSVTCIS